MIVKSLLQHDKYDKLPMDLALFQPDDKPLFRVTDYIFVTLQRDRYHMATRAGYVAVADVSSIIRIPGAGTNLSMSYVHGNAARGFWYRCLFAG